MTTIGADRQARRARGAGAALTALACGATLVGVTAAPAQAEAAVHRVSFDCHYGSTGFYNWVAPPGVTSIKVELAGGAGGSARGDTGKGGKGAVIEATLAIPQPILFGDIGCSGDTGGREEMPGGAGGSGAGGVFEGAHGGAGSFFEAGSNVAPAAMARFYAGGGGGGGGKGTGFGVNAGGDGGDAGARGALKGSLGEFGDNGKPGGGAPGGSPVLGNATCNAPINVQAGQPGQNAVVSGGGGGGGGGGVEGGCGGGAGSLILNVHDRPTIGSGGGGQPGQSQIRSGGGALTSSTLEGKNSGDGYFRITYTLSDRVSG